VLVAFELVDVAVDEEAAEDEAVVAANERGDVVEVVAGVGASAFVPSVLSTTSSLPENTFQTNTEPRHKEVRENENMSIRARVHVRFLLLILFGFNKQDPSTQAQHTLLQHMHTCGSASQHILSIGAERCTIPVDRVAVLD
jgi:hypothetical protein